MRECLLDPEVERVVSVVRRATGTQHPKLREVVHADFHDFTSIAPQLSLNFGNGYGWSYLSGGIGQATWSLVPEGATAAAADEEKIKTINYGGGARWFKKKHIGFSFDIRFYAINPGTPTSAHLVGSPRTRLLVIGAGVSVK